eukprot:TRINITY_DN1692_c1_g1_i1.p1 TRINITY_DN1692_c1_g1~~TRINITY_DN1692_c1_g1_i1.p1  ORF type:complete len:179 (-),score=59.31 TRINITY_DN1692_c1_g1_i1:69-605(-)
MGTKEGKKSRWESAREAVELLAPAVCKADPDGVTVWFFSDQHSVERNVRDERRVRSLFNQYRPGGTTDLAGVLSRAFREHFENGGKDETILVITDGSPDNGEAAEREIVACTQRLRSDEELSISFIQIGEDPGARKYLKRLDTALQPKGAKFDIVDTKTSEEIKGMDFATLIYKSITS